MRIIVFAAAALLAAPAAAQKSTSSSTGCRAATAPYYYAKKLGWYEKEGIDLNLEPGKGSMLAVQRVGGAEPGRPRRHGERADRPRQGRRLGRRVQRLCQLAQGLYWLKSSGIKGIKDFPGKKIGNPAADGARRCGRRSPRRTASTRSRSPG